MPASRPRIARVEDLIPSTPSLFGREPGSPSAVHLRTAKQAQEAEWRDSSSSDVSGDVRSASEFVSAGLQRTRAALPAVLRHGRWKLEESVLPAGEADDVDHGVQIQRPVDVREPFARVTVARTLC